MQRILPSYKFGSSRLKRNGTIISIYSKTLPRSSKSSMAGAAVLQDPIFHDFEYELLEADSKEVVDPRFMKELEKPLVFLFGWAGSEFKHLRKYAGIYHRAGCATFSYILPTRFIFKDNQKIPRLVERITSVLDSNQLVKRPVFVHNFSDTGLMCYQGLQYLAQNKGCELNIVGNIFDSCPGERPYVTVERIFMLGLVNFYCCNRDGLGIIDTLVDTHRLYKLRIWPNLMLQLRGKPVNLNDMMHGEWSGVYVRDEGYKPWPELFLYSTKDTYVDHKYIEIQVIAKHKKDGRKVFAKKWENSKHVLHFATNKMEYTGAVHDFLDEAYFKKYK